MERVATSRDGIALSLPDAARPSGIHRPFPSLCKFSECSDSAAALDPSAALWYPQTVTSARQPPGCVLAADVGGTNTRVALYPVGAPPDAPLALAHVPSAAHASLDALLAAFVDEHRVTGLMGACLAVAGPVIDGAIDVTNLPWRVEARAIAALLGITKLRLVNDLEATAFGMLHLPRDRFEVLQTGTRERAQGRVVVAAAGTGFGLAVLDWDGAHHHPRATESGHVGYAPRNEREIGVLRGLLGRHGRVSVEHIVSGPGLHSVYGVLREASGVPEPEALGRQMQSVDPSAVIAASALAGEDAVCEAALEVFAESYAAAAGDAALAQLALGGVWIGGGIAPKLLPALRHPGFLEAFRDKGPFESLLASLPLEVCLDPDTALMGAGRLALRDAERA